MYERFPNEWTFIDALTSSTVMPVLQRTKFIISLALSDLNRIGRSALFNDHRRVDVPYAFILTDDLSHTDLDQQIPRGGRSHPRPVVSATFVRTTWDEQRPYALPDKHYVSFSFDRSLAHFLSHVRLQYRVSDYVLVVAGLRFSRSISLVVHPAMGLQ